MEIIIECGNDYGCTGEILMKIEKAEVMIKTQLQSFYPKYAKGFSIDFKSPGYYNVMIDDSVDEQMKRIIIETLKDYKIDFTEVLS